jgi:ATP-dependent DNA helicase RecQ
VHNPAPDLNALLKRYFGFEAFRPLQQEIVHDALAGRDVVALLPTGGGKSLCFQLAALALPGLTVVVSPLIALMKDQVDALTASDIPAALLNSSLSGDQARETVQGLDRGKFKLLYVAPERLVMTGFFEQLQRWNLALVAIDEAHCISEWGHDFRPEYRQLATVRERFPNIPLMALTATATERVREDIAKQLRLREPRRYVASFNRPNLSYRVAPKAGAYDQLLAFVRGRKNESGIIYCQSRKSVETLASRLADDGVRAAPYHAGMEPADRSRQQEAFLRDEVRVVCATIAFGMGINKPNVRFVAHYDLPKNVESYYQETGRAGRDGLPGECLLFFSPGDRLKYGRFIDEMNDPKERERALAQLELMVHYAEGAECRRRYLLNYFGEEFPEENCNGCDNCLSPRETWDGTVAAQKFLSCVYRIQEKSGFGMGVTHVVEVLTGSNSEKIRKFGHQTLSTYGIGQEHTRAEWASVGRELVRLGLLRQEAERFNALLLTPQGRDALRSRQKIILTRMIQQPERQAHREGDIECDEILFEKLRDLRKKLADERNVAAYIIFSDVTLRHMAREYPSTPAEFSRISGVGERKRADFGHVFIAEINAHLEEHPPLTFASLPSANAAPARPSLTPTVKETLQLFRQGLEISEIATRRGFVASTIYSHLAAAIEAGQEVDLRRILSAEAEAEIGAALKKFGFGGIGRALESFGGRYEYGHFKIYRAYATRSPSNKPLTQT